MRGCLICPLQSCSYNTHWQGTPQAAICCTKATSFFCSKPGFYYFHLLLLYSCSWGNQQVCSYPPCPCWSLSYRFLPFFFISPFSRLSSSSSPLTLVQQLFPTFDYFPCLSLRLFQAFCIFWDEWQERTAENWRCGITIDLYSTVIMLWFVFYFLPNTSSFFSCF